MTFSFFNRRPSGKDVTRSLNEDTRYTVKASDFGFYDPDYGHTLAAVRIDSLPKAGSLQLNGVAVKAGQVVSRADIDAGKLQFVPAANAYGDNYAGFTFSVQDNKGLFDDCPNCFNLNVCPVNDAPDARDDSAKTAANTAITVNVKANDVDPDNTNAQLTVTQAVLVDPSKGTVSINADGTLSFKPAAGVTGVVDINYTIKDPSGLTDTAKLSITVEDAAPGKRCLTFDFNGNSSTDGTDGNIRTYTVDGVSVHVSAFAREKGATGAWSKAWLGTYGGGLGVTDSQEGSGKDNSHTVDNICRDNFLLFEFDQQVVLDQAFLGYVVCDSDIKVWVGNVSNAYSNHLQLNDTVLQSLGFTEVNQTTLTTSRWADLNAGGIAGNVIIIAADTTDMSPEDQFKLQKLLVCTTGPSNTAPAGADAERTVAEDSAYTLLSADFGFSDADAGQTLTAVRIDTLPGNGTLTLNGVAVAAGQVVSIAAINAGQLRMAPDANENGSPYANFTFSVQDSANTFDTAPNRFTLNVTPVNDAPVAADDIATTAEDTPASGNVLANDSDIDSPALTVLGFSVGGASYAPGATASLPEGQLTLNADGSWAFVPAPNYSGPVPVATYEVSDGSATDTATLSITVTPANDAPVAAPDTNNTDEDTPVSGSVLANDSDPDGTALTVLRFEVNGTVYNAGFPAMLPQGTLELRADGSYTFTPAPNFNGAVPQVTYTAWDGSLEASATLDITVRPVNDAPLAAPDTNSTDEDTPVSGNLVTNDSDIDGDTLTVVSFTAGGVVYAAGATAALPQGSLVVNADGSYTFTPAANFNGVVPQVAYTVTDGGLEASSTLDITVRPVNDAPLANDDTATTAEDTPATGNVLANDSDPDGQPLTVLGFRIEGLPGEQPLGAPVTIPGVGELVLNADGSYTFTPAPNFNGPVPTVTYTATDGTATDTATLSITVGDAADAPVAKPDTNSTDEDTPVSGNVVTNDTDADGDSLSVVSFSIAGATYAAGATATLAQGSLVVRADGSYTFTPAANFNGVVPQATYTVADPSGLNASSTLDITVRPVNDAPVAQDDSGSTPENTLLTGSVITNDGDVDGDALSVTGFTLDGASHAPGDAVPVPGKGLFTLNADGSYIFAPAPNYNGPVPAVQYTVSDGQASATATLTLVVTPVNEAPAANPDAQIIPEDTTATGNVITNDSDGDGDTLTVTEFTIGGEPGVFAPGSTVELLGRGSFTLLANGSYTFVPLPDFNGEVPLVNYTVSDGSLTAESTLQISVTPENDAPTLPLVINAAVSEEGLPGGQPDTVGTPDSTNAAAATGSLGLSDVDNDPLTVALVAPTAALSSGGVAITWAGNGTTSLVGSAGGAEVLRVTVVDGQYTATLLKPLDHSGAGEGALTLDIGLSVTDGPATTTATLRLAVEDDSAVGLNVVQNVPRGAVQTNLLLVLDISGSMNDPSGVIDPTSGNELTRLELEKQAIERLLTEYDALGDVKVRLVTFSTRAQEVGTTWVDLDTARIQIANLRAGGFTNYDFALDSARGAFVDEGRIENGQNVAYFLSDGNPTTADGVTFDPANPDIGIQADEEAVWTGFLSANNITAYALGVGADVSQPNLDPVAYDGVRSANTDGLVVTDLAQLTDTLLATVTAASSGQLTQSTNRAASAFGGDGGHVDFVTVEGSTYTFNAAGAGTIDVNGTDNGRFDAATHKLTITYATGATLVVDMDDGTYTYAAPPTPSGTDPQPGVDSVQFGLVDNDGDRSSGSLSLARNGADLIGSAASDVFRWTLADAGTPPGVSNSVTGFDSAPAATGGDLLDLRDLLQGETAATLEQYLDFENSAGGTLIHVSSGGGFAGGVFNAGQQDLSIQLDVDLRSAFALGTGASDTQVIDELLRRGKLITDPGL